MISYVEAMIKILEDFVHVVTYDAYNLGHLGKPELVSHVEMSWFVSIVRDNLAKPSQIFITASTYDIMTS